jgi:hypothetical protein
MNRIAFANRIKKDIEFLGEHSKKFLTMARENQYSVGVWGRQTGKSTVISVATRDFMRENPNAMCIIVSNKMVLGQYLINSIHLILEDSEIKKRAKNYIQLKNGSVVICSTPNSFERLEKEFSPNLVVVDDFEFIDSAKLENLIEAKKKTENKSFIQKFLCTLFGRCNVKTRYIMLGGRECENFEILKSCLPPGETFYSSMASKGIDPPCSPEMARECTQMAQSK